MTKFNFNSVSSIALCSLMMSAAFARPTTKADYDTASIKVEIFKDKDAFSAEEAISTNFKQITVVSVNGEIKDAYMVSTGDDHEEGVADGWIETPAGYFRFDKVAENFVYFNNSGTNVLEPWGLYFFDVPQVMPPGPQRDQALANNRRNMAALHSYPQNQINGSRLSHGCVRSPEARIKDLWDLVDGTRDTSTNPNTFDAALAIYGKAMVLKRQGDQVLGLPALKREAAFTRAEVRTIRDLL